MEEKTELEKSIDKIEGKVEVIDEPIQFNESMSENIGELAGALAKAQGAMSNGAKDKAGYGYKYMELGSIIDIARKPLADNDISIIQTHQLI